IAQTEYTLRLATDPRDIAGLTSQLVDLRSERARAQFQLDNLEAAAVVVAPPPAAAAAALGAAPAAAPAAAGPAAAPAAAAGVMSHPPARLKALRKQVADLAAGREVVAATLAFGAGVTAVARRLRGADQPPRAVKGRKKKTRR